MRRALQTALDFIESLLKALEDNEAGYVSAYPQRWKQDVCVFKSNLSYIAKHCLKNTKTGHVAVVKHLQRCEKTKQDNNNNKN